MQKSRHWRRRDARCRTVVLLSARYRTRSFSPYYFKTSVVRRFEVDGEGEVIRSRSLLANSHPRQIIKSLEMRVSSAASIA